MAKLPDGAMATVGKASSFGSALTTKTPCATGTPLEVTNRSASMSRLVALTVWCQVMTKEPFDAATSEKSLDPDLSTGVMAVTGFPAAL
jgi:hypothetical protein